AVAFPDYRSKNPSRVQVFSAQSHEPLFETGLKDPPHTLLADPMSGDHIIVDVAAQIRRLGSSHSTTGHADPEISSLMPVLGNVFMKPLDNVSTPNLEDQTRYSGQAVASNDDDDGKLSTKKLSHVFDRASGFTLPA